MSIRCKMDGGNFITESNPDPSIIGQWQLHREFSVVLVGQLNNLGIHSSICDNFTNRRKRKHDNGNAQKILQKYKKQ